MTGIVFAGMGAGTLIMPPVANWLISSYDWRISYIIVGGVVLVVTILAAQFLRRDPEQMGLLPDGDEVRKGGPSLEASGVPFREVIRIRQFWVLCAMIFCFLFILYTIMVHIVAHAIELGVSAAVAANILAIIGGLHVVGTLAMGPFVDRAGSKPAMIISFMLTVAILFWLVVASEVWMLYLFAAIYGLAYGGLTPLFSPMTAELFGVRSHGVIFGALSFIGIIGATIGPVLAGGIFDVTNSYQLAFLVCAIIGIIGLMLTWLIKPANRGALH